MEVITSAFGIEEDVLILKGSNLVISVIRSTDSTKRRALTLFRSDRQKLSEEIKKSGADIYHAHWTYEFALAALSCRTNVLVTAHDAPLKILFHYRDVYRFLRFMMSVLVRIRTNHLSAVSPYLARNWRKQMWWRKQILILPNFTPIEMLETRNQNSRDKKIVLCISDSSRLKNVKTLVQAWKIVRVTFPEATLKLVGYGLGRGEEIYQWAKLNHLEVGIDWIGYVERSTIVDELNQASIVCHPSLEESHSLVLVESLARGLPIIGGIHSGAVPWTLGDAGLLVDVKLDSEIASAILKLLGSTELRTELSNLARLRSTRMFNAQRILPLYLHAYTKIIDDRKS